MAFPASSEPVFNSNPRTKHCWQNYVDYHKCILAKGEDFKPCRQVNENHREHEKAKRKLTDADCSSSSPTDRCAPAPGSIDGTTNARPETSLWIWSIRQMLAAWRREKEEESGHIEGDTSHGEERRREVVWHRQALYIDQGNQPTHTTPSDYPRPILALSPRSIELVSSIPLLQPPWADVQWRGRISHPQDPVRKCPLLFREV